jgi:hypothetical protein
MSKREERLALIEAGPEEDAAEEYLGDKPSKISIRLAAPLYYGLLNFCAEAAKFRGKRVTHMDVFRVLVGMLLDDEDVRKKAIARLRGVK